MELVAAQVDNVKKLLPVKLEHLAYSEKEIAELVKYSLRTSNSILLKLLSSLWKVKLMRIPEKRSKSRKGQCLIYRLVGQGLSLSQADRAICSDNCVRPYSDGEQT